jgi:hypothetical protein
MSYLLVFQWTLYQCDVPCPCCTGFFFQRALPVQAIAGSCQWKRDLLSNLEGWANWASLREPHTFHELRGSSLSQLTLATAA